MTAPALSAQLDTATRLLAGVRLMRSIYAGAVVPRVSAFTSKRWKIMREITQTLSLGRCY